MEKSGHKNHEKLLIKIAALIAECEQLYGIQIVHGDTVKMKHVKRLRKKLYALKQEENIEFVHGIGKRKSPLQKSIETLEGHLERLKGYTKKLHICGKRNSYSKTDPDATFMRMKEDAMGNGQLKPAFNLQHGVDSEYIVWLTTGPQPADATTLIPFLKETEEYLAFKYQKSLQMPDMRAKRIMYFWIKISSWHSSSHRIMKYQKRGHIKMTSAV